MAVPGEFIRIEPDFIKDKKSSSASRVSNFLVTMNTNVRVNVGDEVLGELTEGLYKMMDHLFGASETLAQYVIFGTRGPKEAGKYTFIPDPAITWSSERVRDWKVTAGVEIGHNMRGRRLHCHTAIKIRHYSYIHLDRDKILADANTFLESIGFPYPIVHIDIRVLPPSAEDYLDK